jgi:ubiquinone/menaquinone biosynthesis C-methylase UbiE
MNERTFKASDARKLADPDRRVRLPPSEVTGRLGLLPGMRVADIGAGIGSFSIPIAREIGETGRVFAVDLQSEMLDILRENVREESVANVEPVLGSAVATGLPGHSCDLALLANVWHELDDLPAVLGEVRRILSEGGRVAIVDWRPDADRPPGPPIEHRIPAEQTASQLKSAGWTVQSSSQVGQCHYLILAG